MLLRFAFLAFMVIILLSMFYSRKWPSSPNVFLSVRILLSLSFRWRLCSRDHRADKNIDYYCRICDSLFQLWRTPQLLLGLLQNLRRGISVLVFMFTITISRGWGYISFEVFGNWIRRNFSYKIIYLTKGWSAILDEIKDSHTHYFISSSLI